MDRNRIVEQARLGWPSVNIQLRGWKYHLFYIITNTCCCLLFTCLVGGLCANGITFCIKSVLPGWLKSEHSFMCVCVCVFDLHMFVYTCVRVVEHIPKHAQLEDSGQCQVSCISFHIDFWDIIFHWTCSSSIAYTGWNESFIDPYTSLPPGSPGLISPVPILHIYLIFDILMEVPFHECWLSFFVYMDDKYVL
jgi:hypothetical protein